MQYIGQPVRDRNIRDGLKRKILPRYVHSTDVLVIDEFSLQHGEARIDIAVVNGQLHGFEIKSDHDTLTRLPLQVKIYSSIFDRVTLVVGSRHIQQAMRLIPDWWGVKQVEIGPRGAIHFRSVRRPLNNLEIDSVAVVSLLWRNEALTLLNEIGSGQKLQTKPRAVLYKELATVMERDMLRAKVRQQLKARSDWRSDALLKPSDG